jgi:hypothetical protein
MHVVVLLFSKILSDNLSTYVLRMETASFQHRSALARYVHWVRSIVKYGGVLKTERRITNLNRHVMNVLYMEY